MSFTINQNLCVACGACFGNCTNRAIIRRCEVYFVTEMCSDCGACVNNCPVGAIRKGEIKAELDNKKLDKALKVSMPDLILFPINAHQMCVVSTAYAFDTGEIINGYAGSPTCLMTVPIPFLWKNEDV